MKHRSASSLPLFAWASAGVLLAGCGAQSPPQSTAEVETPASIETVAEMELPVAPSPAGETWIEPHDCGPGASPATIAAAFDVFKLRCDPQRAEQVRPIASAAALATRVGAARGSAARGLAAGGTAAGKLGGSGGAVYSGYSTSDVERLTPLSNGRYEVAMEDGSVFEVDQIRISE